MASERRGINLTAKTLVPRAAFVILLLGMIYGLWLFENVNYVTTYQSLAAMFGAREWVVQISVAIVLVDVLALASVFTPQTKLSKEPLIVQILIAIWFAVSLSDVFLSWYFASLEMESTVVQAPLGVAPVMWMFPLVIAFMIWFVQIGLLKIFGALLEVLVHGRVISVGSFSLPKRKPKPTTGGYAYNSSRSTQAMFDDISTTD